MTNTLLSNNNLFDYGILIGCGLILGCSVFYLIRSNYTANLPTNTEALTKQEIEAIINENAETISNANIEEILTDSDFSTDVVSDYDNGFETDSTDSTVDIEELDLFIMPDVDLNVCPIEELKLFEFNSLYAREIEENDLDDEEILNFLSLFTEDELLTNKINELFLYAISLL
nr:hypothetical protein [Lactarius zonarius]